jgi:hypothetical protein
LKEANRPIAEFFHSGVGIKLQRADSDVMEDAINLLTKEELPYISIHDSLITAHRHHNIANDAMIASWSKQFPEANCRIDTK